MTDTLPTMNDTPQTGREVLSTAEFRLWIDGVGCWMVWLPARLTIGGPQRKGSSLAKSADLSLLADLRSLHTSLDRMGDHYSIAVGAQTSINGQPVLEGDGVASDAAPLRHGLRSGDELTLGSDVRFQFTIPTPLSNTARLVCVSGHRPEERIDGVILMEQLCQLGPQGDHHIVCPRAETPLILFRKGESLWCRSPGEWTLDGRPVSGAASLAHGAVVATESLSFRLEVK